ncbi:polyhomeotic-like protein 1 isoform X2 [Vanacampus margaritifer]
METDNERQRQQEASANESATSGTGPRPLAINSMSLYERQAVQALQALQRQPHAAQYFQQLMLQQHINKAQLHNLATVQQASVTTGSASTASGRPVTVATTSTLSQSLLLSGGAGGRGQMFLRVNRSLRAPISSQLIFMPGGAPPRAAVATVAQPHKQEVTAATTSSSSQTDGELIHNLALRGTSGPKGVKMEAPERSDAAVPSLGPSPNKSSQPAPSPIKIPTYPQPSHLKAHPLLLQATRTLTTGSAAPTTAHALVLTSAAASQARAYPLGTATIKPAAAAVAGGAQTLVVQPLQKSDKAAHANGPVPIQPKTLQGIRLPLQPPSRNPPAIMPAPPPAIMPAPPPAIMPAPPPAIRPGRPLQTPHIPVQIVGARQSTLGSSQTLALPGGGCAQEGAAILASSSSLLTTVASIASREASPAPTSQVEGQKGAIAPAARLPCPPLAREVQRGAMGASASSNATASPIAQSKQTTLKRKLEVNDVAAVQRPPPLRDDRSTLATMDAGSATSSSSVSRSVSRGVGGVGGVGEKAPPPQAVVKPHVLTHVIEGFVIQEGGQPFPLCGPIKDCAGEDLAGLEDSVTVLKCEYCEKLTPTSHFPGSKRFCSILCAKRYELTFDRRPSWEHQSHLSNSEDEGDVAERRTSRKLPRRTSSEIASTKIAGRRLPVKRRAESSRSDSESSSEDDDVASLSPASSSASCHRRPPPSLSSLPPPHAKETPASPASPAHWTVDQVSQFICSLQGCEKLASLFLSQEIDGQALLLLSEEHLVSAMNIKLGPALKICAHIHSLRG